LGQLDAMMRDAPPDSLRALQEEYDRLLASRALAPSSITTGATADTLVDSSIVIEAIPYDTVVAEPRRELPVEPSTPITPGAATASARRGPDSAPASEDPSRVFKGLRPEEIATIPGHERRAAVATSSRRESVRASSARRRAGNRGESRMAASSGPRPTLAAPSSRAETINARGERKELVAGIAAARAGKYADAVTKLAPSVSAGRGGSEGAYYYALSLEKTGQLDRAAQQYLRASRGGGALAERSYLEYCRVLARKGDRQKARQLVTQFLRRNPDSTQAVTARRLLQTL
jgi:TolA-binding protein